MNTQCKYGNCNNNEQSDKHSHLRDIIDSNPVMK